MTTTTTFYRVQKAASGLRENLTGAMSLPAAHAHLQSITENMLANGYQRSDRSIIRKLPVIILAKDMRTVALSVVECTADDIVETKRELAEMSWLGRIPAQTFDLSANEDTREILVDRDLTPDDIYNLRDGSDDFADWQVAQNG